MLAFPLPLSLRILTSTFTKLHKLPTQAYLVGLGATQTLFTGAADRPANATYDPVWPVFEGLSLSEALGFFEGNGNTVRDLRTKGADL